MKKWSDPDTILKFVDAVKEVLVAYFNSKK